MKGEGGERLLFSCLSSFVLCVVVCTSFTIPMRFLPLRLINWIDWWSGSVGPVWRGGLGWVDAWVMSRH